jgi:hypothetical protein
MGALLAAAPARPVISQMPAPPRSASKPCFHARPAPACGGFFLTTAGVYMGHGGRASVDWGYMANASTRNAFGGSWFVAYNGLEDELSTGPVARYRRWFQKSRSLDVAVGTPVFANSTLKPGSILAAVKYNPVHWFGVALRPEMVRRTVYECVDVNCTSQATRTASSGRVFFGVELGWTPGLVLSIGGSLAMGLLAWAYAID